MESMEWTTQFFTVVVTLAVCVCVVRPVKLGPYRIDYVIASVVGVLLLHFVDVMSLRFMWNSLLHTGRVQPWAVLVIFFTLAYASISLDVTGLSKFIAIKFLGAFGKSEEKEIPKDAHPASPSRQLLVAVYVMSGILALIASNDVVILTLTPVLIHYAELKHLDPTPILLVEYTAANTFSAFLLVGNPTNIIVGQGTGLPFLSYLIILAVPSLVAVVGTIVMLFVVTLPRGVSRTVLHANVEDAVNLDVEAELPSSASAASQQTGGVAKQEAVLPPIDGLSAAATEELDVLLHPHLALVDPKGATYRGLLLSTGVIFLILCGYTPIPMWLVTTTTCGTMLVADLFRRRTDYIAPEKDVLEPRKKGFSESARLWWRDSRSCQVCDRMPWPVAPFAVSMFIMVDVLQEVGVTPILTDVVLYWSGQLSPFSMSMLGLVITCVAMNLLNNQPATIFLVSVLLARDGALARMYPQTFSCLVIALILGSNIAASFTVRGALAGIMWSSILTHHNVAITGPQFSKAGFLLMSVPCLLSAVAVWFSSYYVSVTL